MEFDKNRYRKRVTVTIDVLSYDDEPAVLEALSRARYIVANGGLRSDFEAADEPDLFQMTMQMGSVPPKVGMGVTESVGSDCYPFTITRISESGKTFWMKRDQYRRVDNNGLSEDQHYEYEPDPEAGESEVRLTKRGWVHDGKPVHVGSRRAYQDPSF